MQLSLGRSVCTHYPRFTSNSVDPILQNQIWRTKLCRVTRYSDFLGHLLVFKVSEWILQKSPNLQESAFLWIEMITRDFLGALIPNASSRKLCSDDYKYCLRLEIKHVEHQLLRTTVTDIGMWEEIARYGPVVNAFWARWGSVKIQDSPLKGKTKKERKQECSQWFRKTESLKYWNSWIMAHRRDTWG